MKRFKQFFASLILTASLLVPTLALSAPAYAQVDSFAQVELNENLCRGLNLGDDATCPDETSEEPVYNIINTIIDVFSIVVGAVSVIMIIIGGLRYITSSGDSSNVTAARNTILYAVVGLVIVIFAQTIVKFVVSRLAGAQG